MPFSIVFSGRSMITESYLQFRRLGSDIPCGSSRALLCLSFLCRPQVTDHTLPQSAPALSAQRRTLAQRPPCPLRAGLGFALDMDRRLPFSRRVIGRARCDLKLVIACGKLVRCYRKMGYDLPGYMLVGGSADRGNGPRTTPNAKCEASIGSSFPWNQPLDVYDANLGCKCDR